MLIITCFKLHKKTLRNSFRGCSMQGFSINEITDIKEKSNFNERDFILIQICRKVLRFIGYEEFIKISENY